MIEEAAMVAIAWLAALLCLIALCFTIAVAAYWHSKAQRLSHIIDRAEAELVGAAAPGNARMRGRHSARAPLIQDWTEWMAPT